MNNFTFTIEIPVELANEANICDDQKTAYMNALCRLLYKNVGYNKATFKGIFERLIEVTNKHNDVKEKISSEIILPAVYEKYGTKNIEVMWTFMYTDRIATVTRVNESVSVESEASYPTGTFTLLTPVDASDVMPDEMSPDTKIPDVAVSSIETVEAAKRIVEIKPMVDLLEELIGEFADKYPDSTPEAYYSLIDTFASINAEYNTHCSKITDAANGYVRVYMDPDVPMRWSLDFSTLTVNISRDIK